MKKLLILTLAFLLPPGFVPMERETTPLALTQQVWKQTASSFYSSTMNGVDWPAIGKSYEEKVQTVPTAAEALPLINQMLAKLNSSHTRLLANDDPAYYQLLDIFRGRSLWPSIKKRFKEVSYSGIGIFTKNIDGRLFVSGVIDGGPAQKGGLLVGDELLHVDGFDFHPYESFAHKAGKELTLHVRSSKDKLRTIYITPEIIKPYEFFKASIFKSARLVEIDGQEVGYVRIWCYAHSEYHQELVNLLSKGLLRQAKALVLDLRGGWGGADPAFLSLFSKRIPNVQLKFRNGKKRRLLNKEQLSPEFTWSRPVCLLVDETTRSGKEVFAYAFKEYGIGPVVGTPTAGAVVGGTAYFMKDDYLLYLAIADLTCDGKRLEGNPIQPDVLLHHTLPYSAGADPQLECAVALMARSIVSTKKKRSKK